MRGHGINPNVTDKYGLTPLHLAASFNNEDAVKALLQYKDINPNGTGAAPITPIEAALYTIYRIPQAGVLQRLKGLFSQQPPQVGQGILNIISMILNHPRTNATAIPLEKYENNQATELIRKHVQEIQDFKHILHKTALHIQELNNQIRSTV